MAQKGRSLTIALLLAIPMVFQFGLPAQANFRQILRGILRGDTGQGARGNARGAAIRDRRCSAEGPRDSPRDSTRDSTSQGGAAIAAPASPIDPTDQLTLLVPNIGQSLTTTTIPAVFVYIPPRTSGAVAQASPLTLEALTPEFTNNSSQTKIDLNDIDSVIDQTIQENVEQAQRPKLLLEFQFGDTIQQYSLPDKALIAKIQVPEGTAFEIGATLPLEVRLVCRRVDLTTLSQTAETEFSYSAESEVFVDVQRIEPSNTLLAAIATYAPDDIYQLYLENGLWFEMLVALAATPESDEWTALLEVLEIPEVDPTPQNLFPIGD